MTQSKYATNFLQWGNEALAAREAGLHEINGRDVGKLLKPPEAQKNLDRAEWDQLAENSPWMTTL